MKIVYPPENHSTDSETIFFIGSAQEYCFINGRDVELVHEGNFCPIFNLKMGKNVFIADVDDNEYKFVIERTEKKDEEKEQEFKLYSGKEVSESFSKICLDAGHGGEQIGARSPKNFPEKDLNLYLVAIIAEEFEKLGIDYVLTREGDFELSLEERVKISEESGCDLFLSIHHNAIPDHLNPLENKGISAHYYYEHSKKLAEDLAEHLCQALNMENRSAIQQDLFVTRENLHSKALLLECGYMIHPEESELIFTKEYQEAFAKSLGEFLSKFIKNS